MTRRRLLTTHPTLVVSPEARFSAPRWTEQAQSEWSQALDDFRDLCRLLSYGNGRLLEEVLLAERRSVNMAFSSEPPRWFRFTPVLDDGYTESPSPLGNLAAAAFDFWHRSKPFGRLAGERAFAGERWQPAFTEWEAEDAATVCPHSDWNRQSVDWFLADR